MSSLPDEVVDGRWKLGYHIAMQGLDGCTNQRCTRLIDRETREDVGCAGYHCPVCLAPTSMMGHRCPDRGET